MVAAVYHDTNDPGRFQANRPADSAAGEARRLNVLVTDRGERWSSQLPCLLEPQGVQAYRVRNSGEAVELIEATPIHVAVVDMYLDTEADAAPTPQRLPGGLKLLQVIQRIEARPPAVLVVRSRHFDPRVDNFVLAEALKLNAFTVLDQPVELEQMLAVLRRALERYFGGAWPT